MINILKTLNNKNTTQNLNSFQFILKRAIHLTVSIQKKFYMMKIRSIIAFFENIYIYHDYLFHVKL